MRTRVILLCALAVSVASFASAQPPAKVGIIHIQNALLGTKDGQKALAELEAKSLPKKKELEQEQSGIAALRDQLSKSSNAGSEDAKNRLMRDIDTKTKAFNRKVEDAQADLDQEQGKVLNEIGGRMMAVLDKYAKDNGYALVLDVSSQQTPVLFAANGIDITQDIVALYDKNAPAASGAAAAPAMTPPAAAPTRMAPARPLGGGTAAPRSPAVRPGTPAK
ncbi:MAG TPA: OmpH family outer membrane protein [Bryobacteraceae bacterium]|nr:OmpH family outer membrane protein [Bryobacteraceae bacterium]